MKSVLSLKGADSFTFALARAKSSPSRSKPVTCFAFPAARGIGSIFARSGASARFASFRTPPAGRPTTPRAARPQLRSGLLRPGVHSAARFHGLNLAPAFEPAKIRAVLLDIEGTTTPIDFVFKTLFPYAAAQAEEFLQSHNEDAEIKTILEALRRQHVADSAGDSQIHPWFDSTSLQNCASAAKYVRWLIER